MDTLQFARQEAGELPVELLVRSGPGDGYDIERLGAGFRVTGTNARSCLHGVYHLRAGRPPGSYRAAFAIRGINTCESLPCHTPAELRSLIDRMGRWRMNTLIVHVAYGWRRHRELIVRECAKRGIDLVFYTYTSLAFLPRDAPAAWLARDEQGRPLTTRPQCETRLCLAQHEGLRAFEEGAERFFAEEVTDAASVLAMTGDGYGHCRCPSCRGLSPLEQWQPLLERFARAGRARALGKLLESLLYVQRYALPSDPACTLGLDRLLFDLHQRCRWRPLGEEHPPVFHREGEVDSRARDVPLNRYLLDRVAEWRSTFRGRLYLFENLYLHATLSCPQPNTGVLLDDLRRLRSLGVDGMVYEVLAGMGSFESQLGLLADALWDPESVTHAPSAAEQWCSRNCPPGPLFFLESTGFPWDALREGWEPVVRAHMENLRTFFSRRTLPNLSRVIEHMEAHPGRFHRQFIAFQLLKQYVREAGPSGLEARHRRLLDTVKLWDFMEDLDDPIAETDEALRDLLHVLRDADAVQKTT